MSDMPEETRPRPTEKLIVRNFLSIRSAELDIKRFNVIIGTQAQGKSILATLVYYFRQFLTDQVTSSIYNEDDRQTFERNILLRFTELFPLDTRYDEQFELHYTSGALEVKISKQEGQNVVLKYPNDLETARVEAIEAIKSERADLESLSGAARRVQTMMVNRVPFRYIRGSKFGKSFGRSIFIPSSRTFFANVDQNIFSFLVKDIRIDPLLEEFGAIYERRKNNPMYGDRDYFGTLSFPEQTVGNLYIEPILMGKYLRDNNQDWIVSKNGRRTKIINASSGQQASLPMLYVLAEGVYRGNEGIDDKDMMYFVEELEAHLFPNNQKIVIEMMAHLYNYSNLSFFLTTHSPYVLTAINNLVYASNVSEMSDEKKQGVNQIVPEYHLIRAEDLSAYMLEDGELREIIDEDDGLIESDMIDGVSDEFEAVYDKLLRIEFDHEL